MMVDSVEFAKFIISRILEINKTLENPLKIGATKLHKLIYICDGFLLASEINFIKERARAWNYGPVYPRVSKWLAKTPDALTGSYPCEHSTVSAINNIGAAPLVDAVLNKYGFKTAGQLSIWSHQPGSPWEKALEKGWGAMNSPINKEDMRFYFKGLLDGRQTP